MYKKRLPVLLGFLLDLLWGDPQNLPHPICWIGTLIATLEQKIRGCLPKTKEGEQRGGQYLVVLVLVISVGVPAIVLAVAGLLGAGIVFVLETLLCWYMLAAKSLKKESMAVVKALEAEGLEAGRKAVSRIVGRDTEVLTEEGVIKAAVETVAENTSDGVVAPLLYMTIGGPLGGVFYKAVNTMDSMIGYRNEKYQYFGTCAAKLDDVLNYIPSRFSALCMVLAAKCLGYNSKNSFLIWRRDGRNHASPNSAQTEAACAGALEVQLAGDAWYFGKKYQKPFIGDKKRMVEREDIARANKLLYGTAMIAVAVCTTAVVFYDMYRKKGGNI